MMNQMPIALTIALMLTLSCGAASAERWGAVCRVDEPGSGRCFKQFSNKPSEGEQCSCRSSQGRTFRGRLSDVEALTPDGSYSGVAPPPPAPPPPAGLTCRRPQVPDRGWATSRDGFLKFWLVGAPATMIEQGLMGPKLHSAVHQLCSIKAELGRASLVYAYVAMEVSDDLQMEIGLSGARRTLDTTIRRLRECGVSERPGNSTGQIHTVERPRDGSIVKIGFELGCDWVRE